MPNPNDQNSDEFIPFESDPEWPIRHVGLFCDRGCATQIEGDFRANDRAEAYAALRTYAAKQGWTITEEMDVCPACGSIPDQPDGLDDEYPAVLPEPARADERVGRVVAAFGDGLMDVIGGKPLYARDLSALCRSVEQAPQGDDDRCGVTS